MRTRAPTTRWRRSSWRGGALRVDKVDGRWSQGASYMTRDHRIVLLAKSSLLVSIAMTVYSHIELKAQTCQAKGITSSTYSIKQEPGSNKPPPQCIFSSCTLLKNHVQQGLAGAGARDLLSSSLSGEAVGRGLGQ
uniref:Uncharacterized protein n=1 Tax=Oryza punctata TaxID=4537 RepID=A0A0E0KSU7_ORYPU